VRQGNIPIVVENHTVALFVEHYSPGPFLRYMSESIDGIAEMSNDLANVACMSVEMPSKPGELFFLILGNTSSRSLADMNRAGIGCGAAVVCRRHGASPGRFALDMGLVLELI
jgi:hypothetical protein